MNAYSHFYPHAITQEATALNQRRYTARCSSLTEAQLEFLNSEACRRVSPYSWTFWPDLLNLLDADSQKVQALPKAPDYRSTLEPYLLRRVHMTAATWSLRDSGDNYICLLLRSVRLTHVHGGAVGAAPNVMTDHMNIWVSPAWFNHVAPPCGKPLALAGVLYEYASKQTRNIGVLPVLLMPENRRRNVKWRNCAACPGRQPCPDCAA